MGYPERSVRNYHYSLSNNPKERSSNLGHLYQRRRRRRNHSKRRTVDDPATRRDKPQAVRQEHPHCRHLTDETLTSPHRDINIQAQKSVEWSMAIFKLRAALDGSTVSLVRWHKHMKENSKRKWQIEHGKSCIYRHPVEVSLAAERCRTAATCLQVLDTVPSVPATHRLLTATSQCICVCVCVCVRACTSGLPINTISFSTELVIASSQGFAALLLRFQFLCDVTQRYWKQNLVSENRRHITQSRDVTCHRNGILFWSLS